MKTTFALDVPTCSAHFCNAIKEAFKNYGFVATVCTDSEMARDQVVHHLLPAIEPADPKQKLFIQVNSTSSTLLNDTLLNERFVISIVELMHPSDLFALECLVTSCIGHEVTLTYLRQMKAPAKVIKSATAAAKKSSWIERILGTPSAQDLLSEFADELIARGTHR